MMATKVMVASAAVTLKLAVAVVPPCSTCFRNESSARVQHPVIEQAEHVEDRNQADGVRAEDEDEERQQQRRPGVHPLAADVRLHDRVAHELDDRFERVHEARTEQAVLLQIAPHRPGDDHEDEAATSHSMNTCLVTEKSMPSDRRQVNQRMIEAAVRDVLDDHLAGVELLGGACGRAACS